MELRLGYLNIIPQWRCLVYVVSIPTPSHYDVLTYHLRGSNPTLVNVGDSFYFLSFFFGAEKIVVWTSRRFSLVFELSLYRGLFCDKLFFGGLIMDIWHSAATYYLDVPFEVGLKIA